MESEANQQFLKFLLHRGFPSDAIVPEPSLSVGFPVPGRRYRADFAIIDGKSRDYAAVFEVTGEGFFSHAGTHGMMESLAVRFKAAGIPFYVAETQTGGSFRIWSLSPEGKLAIVPDSLFPSYQTLSSRFVVEKKQDIATKKEEARDTLKYACYILSAISLCVVVADFFLAQAGIVLLTPERFGLIGASIALVVIPFAQRFKALGVEWERYEKKSNKEDEEEG